jgi:hypothetical protein
MPSTRSLLVVLVILLQISLAISFAVESSPAFSRGSPLFALGTNQTPVYRFGYKVSHINQLNVATAADPYTSPSARAASPSNSPAFAVNPRKLVVEEDNEPVVRAVFMGQGSDVDRDRLRCANA